MIKQFFLKIWNRIRKRSKNHSLPTWYTRDGLASSEIDLNEARREASNFELSISKTPHAYFQRALAYGREKNYKQAIEDFTNAISLSPKLSQAYFLRGSAYHQTEQFGQAIDDYTKCLEFEPKNISVLLARSKSIYANTHSEDAVIVDLVRILEFAPNNADTLVERSYLYLQKNEYEKAFEDANQALVHSPDLIYALNNRGRALTWLNRLDEALTDFDRGIQLKQNYALLYQNRGDVWKLKKEYERAIEDYTTAIKLEPSASVYSRRGFIYFCLENYDAALKDYNKSLEIDPNDPLALNNKAYLLLRLGKLETALPFADQAINIRPRATSFLHTRGSIFSQLGRVQEAIRDYKEALENVTAESESIRAEMEEYIQKHTGTAFPKG